MTKGQKAVASPMRPNIQISHALNGRVKDYAADNDMQLTDAYEQIIRTGLAELAGEETNAAPENQD